MGFICEKLRIFSSHLDHTIKPLSPPRSHNGSDDMTGFEGHDGREVIPDVYLLPKISIQTVRWGRSLQRFPNRLWANTGLGVWQKETSTDRSWFEAKRGLTDQEATSSIRS
jgi:hypothetical protein